MTWTVEGATDFFNFPSSALDRWAHFIIFPLVTLFFLLLPYLIPMPSPESGFTGNYLFIFFYLPVTCFIEVGFGLYFTINHRQFLDADGVDVLDKRRFLLALVAGSTCAPICYAGCYFLVFDYFPLPFGSLAINFVIPPVLVCIIFFMPNVNTGGARLKLLSQSKHIVLVCAVQVHVLILTRIVFSRTTGLTQNAVALMFPIIRMASMKLASKSDPAESMGKEYPMACTSAPLAVIPTAVSVIFSTTAFQAKSNLVSSIIMVMGEMYGQVVLAGKLWRLVKLNPELRTHSRHYSQLSRQITNEILAQRGDTNFARTLDSVRSSLGLSSRRSESSSVQSSISSVSSVVEEDEVPPPSSSSSVVGSGVSSTISHSGSIGKVSNGSRSGGSVVNPGVSISKRSGHRSPQSGTRLAGTAVSESGGSQRGSRPQSDAAGGSSVASAVSESSELIVVRSNPSNGRKKKKRAHKVAPVTSTDETNDGEHSNKGGADDDSEERAPARVGFVDQQAGSLTSLPRHNRAALPRVGRNPGGLATVGELVSAAVASSIGRIGAEEFDGAPVGRSQSMTPVVVDAQLGEDMGHMFLLCSKLAAEEYVEVVIPPVYLCFVLIVYHVLPNGKYFYEFGTWTPLDDAQVENLTMFVLLSFVLEMSMGALVVWMIRRVYGLDLMGLLHFMMTRSVLLVSVPTALLTHIGGFMFMTNGCDFTFAFDWSKNDDGTGPDL